VAVGHQDHRSVAVSPSVAVGGLEQPFDLGIRQVFAGAKVGIWLGSALAMAISYTTNHSISWALIHRILGLFTSPFFVRNKRYAHVPPLQIIRY